MWTYNLRLYCVVSVWCVPTVLQVKCRLGSQPVALLDDGGMSKGGPSGKSWVTEKGGDLHTATGSASSSLSFSFPMRK